MKGKIMIVDDNETVLQFSRKALVGAGLEVATRSAAVGTTVALMRERPDVALIDVNMPLLEGDELVRSIRKRATLSGTVVLLYSSMPSRELQQLARDCGADGFISKSSTAPELVAEVTRWISVKSHRERLSSRKSRSAETEDTAYKE